MVSLQMFRWRRGEREEEEEEEEEEEVDKQMEVEEEPQGTQPSARRISKASGNQEREIDYLEVEHTHSKVDMEEAHRRQLEIKQSDLELRKADADVFEREAELYRCKVHFAELNNGPVVGASGSSATAGPSGT
ncbi:hypothetical protein PAXRUDRAFT_19096 [Paxillus rubicundulus Ve08.2h10]|uniref:Uncharacterized protein n=1 Tax=Paxillus rubicundulus Ve08.2h10 TaxID=930991 RepID=A0A0D0BV79_9AGAM|nr:hypothetical protein PAXRUDRAFT_19096 [Paxillus rubicundulus Ve08.2h10]